MRVFLLALPLLAGCNWIGNVTGLNDDANKAIGAACRQTGRSLEECFLRNPDAGQDQIYAGWREMNEYMVRNKLDTMAPPADKEAKAASGVKPAVAKPPATVQMAPPAQPPGPRALTTEEADKQAANAAPVKAAPSARRARAGAEPRGAAPEADQQRLLEVIKDIQAQSPS